MVSCGSEVYAIVLSVPLCSWDSRLTSEQLEKRGKEGCFIPEFISQMDRSLERRRQAGKTIGLAAASWAMGT